MVMVLDQLIGNYNMQFIVNIAELIVISNYLCIIFKLLP